ncbi:hypothetical protein J1605_010813 [Eschrichtius robustus]|uniref:Uncharacterized protein n=1 Tax=Eschrichtius robustus TaxID=9764 RepID=A0AB34GQM3_ESCRO|nr:hypothetical protein J1605_010813 [Eschrichtius robustus]
MKVKLNSAAACIFPSETKGGGRRRLTQQVRSRDSGTVTPARGRPSGSLPEAGGDPGARAPARVPRPAQREAAVRGRRTPISGRRGRRGVTVSAPRPARGPQAPDPPAAGARDRKRERAMELRRLWLLCCCCGCCPGAAPAPPSGRNPPAAFRVPRSPGALPAGLSREGEGDLSTPRGGGGGPERTPGSPGLPVPGWGRGA